MRIFTAEALAAAILLPLPALGSSSAAGDCDASKVAKGYRCDTCKRDLGEFDMRNGVCKRCEEEPGTYDLCLKYDVFFQASCHPAKKGQKPIFC